MAPRIGGIAYIKQDGSQLDLRGNFSVSPSMLERKMQAGQDGVHGYTEDPRVPYIEGDITTGPILNIADLDAITSATITAELANGKTYTLQQACTVAAHVVNTKEGIVHVRWEGFNADEF